MRIFDSFKNAHFHTITANSMAYPYFFMYTPMQHLLKWLSHKILMYNISLFKKFRTLIQTHLNQISMPYICQN